MSDLFSCVHRLHPLIVLQVRERRRKDDLPGGHSRHQVGNRIGCRKLIFLTCANHSAASPMVDESDDGDRDENLPYDSLPALK